MICYNCFSYLKMEGNKGLDLSATSDNLSLRSLNNIDIKTREGKIILTSGEVLMPGLPTLNTTTDEDSRRQYNYGAGVMNTVYQACVCASGKMFLVLPTSECVANKDFCKH